MRDRIQIYPYIYLDEFACPCCGMVPATLSGELVHKIHMLRVSFGMVIIYGYRCLRHNEEIGGAPGSQHVLGRAADLIFPDMFQYEDWPERVAREAIDLDFNGVGSYTAHVHVDTRRLLPGEKPWRHRGGVSK